MLKSCVAEEKYRLHLYMKQQVQSPVRLCSEPHCPLICKGYHTLPSKLCAASMPIEGPTWHSSGHMVASYVSLSFATM